MLHRRNLCWTCYRKKAIRFRYPILHGTRTGPIRQVRDGPPLEATAAVPGSEAKILAMMRRAGAGESLFHPDDAHLDDLPD